MPVSKLYIRRASPDDAELLAELGARTFRETFGPDNIQDDMDSYVTSAFAPNQVAAELADPACAFLLAYVDQEVVGYAKLTAGEAPVNVGAPLFVELARIYVDQSVIGKGYGAALMECCLELARETGYELIWLGVWERNEHARAFYRRWRFEEVGSHDFVLGNDVQTDIIMQRRV